MIERPNLHHFRHYQLTACTACESQLLDSAAPASVFHSPLPSSAAAAVQQLTAVQLTAVQITTANICLLQLIKRTNSALLGTFDVFIAFISASASSAQ